MTPRLLMSPQQERRRRRLLSTGCRLIRPRLARLSLLRLELVGEEALATDDLDYPLLGEGETRNRLPPRPNRILLLAPILIPIIHRILHPPPPILTFTLTKLILPSKYPKDLIRTRHKIFRRLQEERCPRPQLLPRHRLGLGHPPSSAGNLACPSRLRRRDRHLQLVVHRVLATLTVTSQSCLRRRGDHLPVALRLSVRYHQHRRTGLIAITNLQVLSHQTGHR